MAKRTLKSAGRRNRQAPKEKPPASRLSVELERLRDRYIARGGSLLTRRELELEIAERRGLVMTPMKRTTIYLSERLHEQLREEAFRTKVSMAELIRSRLEVDPRSGQRGDPLADIEGIIEDGSLSRNIERDLYR